MTPTSSTTSTSKAKTSSKTDHDKGDWSVSVIKIVSSMVLFMAGAVLGLSLGASRFTPYLSNQTAELFFPSKMYTANCAKERLSIENFVHPALPAHDMSDEELFWRATLVSRRDGYPFERVPRVAFMFMTRGPLPFLPMWERFFRGINRGLFSVYVHTLPNYNLNVNETSAFYGRQIPSKETSWGSISLVDAEKRLMANALLDFSNERFVLLSESCIPVFNFSTVYDYLTNSAHSFVEAYDEDSPRGRGRYSRHMWPDIRLHQWRKGSEWFEISRELAVHVVADRKYYRIFSKHCTPSCYPDEHYIPTYLNMFHGASNSNRTVTWVDWSQLGPHPASYGPENVTVEFIRSIRSNGTTCMYNFRPTSTCYLFARKFTPGALEPLLKLTTTLMQF